MNANKQDAGGLPELLPRPHCGGESETCHEPGYGWMVRCMCCSKQFFQPNEAQAVDNWNRRNGEQCRAASVSATEIESVIERLAAEAAACITVLGRAPEASDVRVMLDAAKLLRALPRGVPEGMVLVPVSSAKMVSHVCSEWIDLFRDAPGLDKYERYSYEPAVEELRDEFAAIAAQRKEG